VLQANQWPMKLDEWLLTPDDRRTAIFRFAIHWIGVDRRFPGRTD